jgi:leucyl/phenylalanyl-tRNA--protein transferase
VIPHLDPKNPHQAFPSGDQALEEPNGLLAIGGCLSKERLVNAYRQGIFPWFSEGEPILWWSPDPRLVLIPDQLKVSKSLRQQRRKPLWEVTHDRAFEAVMAACAAPRRDGEGTWISPAIQKAYRVLHHQGIAHSFEAWQEGVLVGGLYGVALGQVFFGESMFHRVTDASKVAFVTAVERLRTWDYQLIDCQVQTDHLSSLGALPMPRAEFLLALNRLCDKPVSVSAWGVSQ